MRIARNEEELDWMGSDCWFCGLRPPVPGKSSIFKMKKFTDGTADTVGVLRSSVAVPRCAECALGHKRALMGYVNGAIAVAVVVFLIVVVWQPLEMSGLMMALLVIVGFVIGAVIGGSMVKLPQGQKPESAAESFVAVEQMRMGGWMKDDQL